MRKDFQIIASFIEEGSKVLDLGCGNGDLLDYLKKKSAIIGRGVEIKLSRVKESIEKGISVIHADMEGGLSYFPEDWFDVVILSRTIQEIAQAQQVIEEMFRVGRRVIVAFLNYGYYKNRLQFLFHGRKPLSEALPEPWYNTSNIHPLSIGDFEQFVHQRNLTIVKKTFLKGDWEKESNFLPHLFAGYAIYLIEKDTSKPLAENGDPLPSVD